MEGEEEGEDEEEEEEDLVNEYYFVQKGNNYIDMCPELCLQKDFGEISLRKK